MRVILAILLTLLPAIGLSDVRSCQILYTNGPQSLGGYRLTNGLNLEARHQGDGFMLRYQRSTGDVVSVVFFDNGKKRISQKAALQELVKAATFVTSFINNGRSPSEPLGIYELAEFQTMEAKAIIPSPKTAGNNFMATGVVNNCLVKLRYTTGGSPKRANGKFQRLLSDLDAHLLQ